MGIMRKASTLVFYKFREILILYSR